MTQKLKKQKNESEVWLKNTLRPYRYTVFMLTALNVSGVLFSLAFSYLAQYVINYGADKNKQGLLAFSAILLVVLLTRVLLNTITGYYAEKSRAKMTVGLRQRVFSRTLYADYRTSEHYHSGDLLNRLTSDVSEVVAATVYIVPGLAGTIIQSVGAACALLSLDSLFTFVFIVGALAANGALALLKKRIKRYHKEVMEADGESRAFMQESSVSALTLKAYGLEEKTAEKSERILEKYYEKRMKRNRLNAFTSGSFSLLSGIGMIFAVIWCGIGIMKGTLDPGKTLSIVLLLGQLQRPLNSLSSILSLYYARAASGERLAEIDKQTNDSLSEKRKEASKENYSRLKTLEIRDITFGYGDKKIFDGASATIEKGAFTCITGESGAGKSTLFKLLLNVYTSEKGGIYANENTDVRLLSDPSRSLFAYVPQENFLFSGSIGENLVFFANETDESVLNEKLDRALDTACAGFVRSLPDGLNTVLSEHGKGLSEGQKQRLAVARALLSEHPILLLDEATSALDEETEIRLLENLKNLSDKTCIIVTHRPAALTIADCVLHVKNGKIETITEEKAWTKQNL